VVVNQPQDVATAFVTRWARPDLAADHWRADLEPLSTGPLYTSMRYVDPARVPASRALGPATLMQQNDTTATVRVATNGGTIEVTLRRIGGQWRVDQIVPVDQPPTVPPPDLRPTAAVSS
jgi:hypothetical protein